MNTQTVSVRLPSQLVNRLDVLARRDHRSRSQWIALVLEQVVSGAAVPDATITPERKNVVRREVEPRFKR